MAQIVDWNEDHPVMAGLELGGRVTIARAQNIEVEQGAAVEVLAETTDGPVIFDASTGTARAIITSFNPDDSSWPLDVSYVVFHASAINALGGVTGSATAGSVRPGGTISERLPIGATNVRLEIPESADINLAPAPDGRVAFGPVPRAGVYTLRWTGAAGITDEFEDGRAARHIAVNLLDPQESDIRSNAVLSFASGDIEAAARGSAEAPRRLWPWLLLGALAVSLFEWWIYN